MSGRVLTGLLILAAMTGVARAGMIDQKPLPPSLYDRLGGKSTVSLIVDDFVARIRDDARLNGRFAGADASPLKALFVDEFCAAAGGPDPSAPRREPPAPSGAAITDPEFDALTEDLVRALEKVGVPTPEQGELVAILGRLRPALGRQ
jgi:hemoglobin